LPRAFSFGSNLATGAGIASGSVAAEEAAIPFSSMNDPVDLARAQAALETAWNEIRPTVAAEDAAKERAKLAYIVAGLVAVVEDRKNLRKRVVERYQQTSLA